MATTSDIKKGLCINYNNDIYKIIEFLHVKPGKGPAFVRTKLKSLTTGKIIDNTFSAGHKIDDIRIQTKKFQYLYNDGHSYHFMDDETYEQIQLPETMIDNPQFLKEGETVTILMKADDNLPLTLEMPATVIMEVTHTEPGVKGNTATNATKPATIETGATVKVPLFINEGDKIKINTETGEYQERIK
jgi:elongation factor P